MPSAHLAYASSAKPGSASILPLGQSETIYAPMPSSLRTKSRKDSAWMGGRLTSFMQLPVEELQLNIKLQLCDWIFTSLQRFLVVKSELFRPLMKLVNPAIVFPSRRTVQRRILKMEEDRWVHMSSLLRQKRGKVSLACDTWSSRVCRGYMVVNAHWTNAKWTLTLKFRRFNTPHTGYAFSKK